MAQLEMIGTGGIADRRLFLLELGANEELPDELALQSEHFACGLLLNAEAMTVSAISDLTEALLSKGMAYSSTWGPDCKRVHDMIDMNICGDGIEEPQYSLAVMTTSHHNESLEDFIWFFLHLTSPGEPFEHSCNAGLLVCQSSFISAAVVRKQVLREIDAHR